MPYHPASDYLDLTQIQCPEIFEGVEEVWQVLPNIAPWLAYLGEGWNAADFRGNADKTAYVAPDVTVGKNSLIMPGVCIQGPAWIGEGCRISPGCWIRENVIVGHGVILGNSCELKNCIIFNEAELPHWNYVGDSILGYKAHLGAGVILSNWRHDHGSIPIMDQRVEGGRIDTGLPKLGAVVGDYADIGANAVLNPGALIGRRSILYPGIIWRGTLPADRIVKNRQYHEVAERLWAEE